MNSLGFRKEQLEQQAKKREQKNLKKEASRQNLKAVQTKGGSGSSLLSNPAVIVVAAVGVAAVTYIGGFLS